MKDEELTRKAKILLIEILKDNSINENQVKELVEELPILRNGFPTLKEFYGETDLNDFSHKLQDQE